MADNISGMAPRDTAPEIKDSKWYQPRAAMHAIRALMQDPEDTSQVFRVTRAMGGPSQYKGFRRFCTSAVGRRVLARRQDLADVLNDRDMLRALPDGSLGRAYLEFVERENLSADGLTDASVKGGRIIKDPDLALYAARTRDMHDLWHVTTGYGRDGLGELSLLAFTYAQLGNIGIAMIIYFGARGGVRESGDKRIWKAIWEGYRNGRSATWWAAEDWEGLLAAPLEEVRKQLKFAPASTYRQVFQDHLAAAQAAPAV
ncbi:ubiquinone biosynthesis protein [Pyruvatibacter mobilis]|uniref:Ubiquinone biosynthesis protein n=1 Tax=Pyruvatibacter mobilis TaxID=1712261 RepID=A0A845QEN1_9HYPH|nr:Coq4 family protein [Pyruvatibacter mobilis]NBG96824.1 ubiquinone biosynthesis protein [Pyruvatibacter mobilis]QJD74793.1 ubiquinone biosynthesis protein [Pyruvatibacter mobilis]GGD10140.1 hypothetical protein GCM10011587_12580 [Pyruvatibacter mobilis]